jgi:hypothetical protein
LHNDLLSEVVTVRGVRPTGGRINALPSRSLDDGFLRFVWNKSHGNSLKEGMDQRERGRERHRERERGRQRQRGRDRERDIGRETETETERERSKRRERETREGDQVTWIAKQIHWKRIKNHILNQGL